MLQQRKVVSIGEYRQIHRILPPSKGASWSELIKEMLLGILAVATFIMGMIFAFGQ